MVRVGVSVRVAIRVGMPVPEIGYGCNARTANNGKSGYGLLLRQPADVDTAVLTRRRCK